jgi:hypothetical protein
MNDIIYVSNNFYSYKNITALDFKHIVKYLDKRRLYHDYDEGIKTIFINSLTYGFYIEKLWIT